MCKNFTLTPHCLKNKSQILDHAFGVIIPVQPHLSILSLRSGSVYTTVVVQTYLRNMPLTFVRIIHQHRDSERDGKRGSDYNFKRYVPFWHLTAFSFPFFLFFSISSNLLYLCSLQWPFLHFLSPECETHLKWLIEW